MIVVIGGRRQSIHDFRRLVGMISREHVEFEDERNGIADFKHGRWRKIRKGRRRCGGRRIKILNKNGS